MTALGKLFRTTAFRLTLVYLFVFALFAAFLLVYVAFNMRRLITEQITSTVDAEIGGLAEQYNQGGIRRLVFVIEQRSRRPGSSIYLVTSPTGDGIAGNIGALAPGILDRPGWIETAYRRSEEKEAADNQALARVFVLPGGFRLLVGRDLEERERVYSIVESAGRWSVAVVVILGIAGGVFVSRRVLTRIDAMTQTAQTIMAGNLSGRLPVGRSGDELDRLAGNLNDMLERIEALMQGLKEVSDNVAHDLKTPLTRLHNRCEEALRTAKTEREFRTALEETIAESDEIIRTFNALAADRAYRIRWRARQHDRVRCRRRRARRGGTLRAGGGGGGTGTQGRRGAVADERQPGTGQPGTGESARQRDQVCRAGRQTDKRSVPEIAITSAKPTTVSTCR